MSTRLYIQKVASNNNMIQPLFKTTVYIPSNSLTSQK